MSRPIVLIHGAWHGGWCFDEVAGPLRDRGFGVHAPDLPLSGAGDDVATAREVIAANPGAVVLGHSYGGVVISHAAVGLPVSRLVYLCAIVPGQDENVAAALAAAPSSGLLPAAMIATEDGRTAIDPEKGVEAFYHDCPDHLIEVAKKRLRPMQMPDMRGPATAPPYLETPSTYVVCTEDRALHPDWQRQMAGRTSEVIEWQVSHSPFFARPDLMIDLLAGYAD